LQISPEIDLNEFSYLTDQQIDQKVQILLLNSITSTKSYQIFSEFPFKDYTLGYEEKDCGELFPMSSLLAIKLVK